MTANPYEEGSLQHEMWNNIHNKKVEKERIDYVESLKELIEIEKKSKQEAIFSEKYIRQLERRIKIFQAGKAETLKSVNEILDRSELNQNDYEDLKSKIGALVK